MFTVADGGRQTQRLAEIEGGSEEEERVHARSREGGRYWEDSQRGKIGIPRQIIVVGECST